jgi:hypothetical protein
MRSRHDQSVRCKSISVVDNTAYPFSEELGDLAGKGFAEYLHSMRPLQEITKRQHSTRALEHCNRSAIHTSTSTGTSTSAVGLRTDKLLEEVQHESHGSTR